MSEEKKRVDVEEQLEEVSGGGINIGAVMGEVAKAKANGEKATFLGALIEEVIEDITGNGAN